MKRKKKRASGQNFLGNKEIDKKEMEQKNWRNMEFWKKKTQPKTNWKNWSGKTEELNSEVFGDQSIYHSM